MARRGLIDMPATSKLIPEIVLRRDIMGIGASTFGRIRLDIANGGDKDQLPPAITIRKRRFYSPTDVDAWKVRRRGLIIYPDPTGDGFRLRTNISRKAAYIIAATPSLRRTL